MLKNYFFILVLATLISLSMFVAYNFKIIGFCFLPRKMEGVSIFDFNLNMDWHVLYFFIIVFIVTSLVVLYREVYIEHYNNKKFFYLLIFFFSSIITLSISGSIIMLIIGWDGLGLTSICLIIFYPNSNTLYNSMMTMFFNRLGDVVLIICLRFIISIPRDSYFLSYVDRKILFFLLTICSLTKRAQFPLSSWLPAAISAPTPISAIVHSSTLVTAGIFLIHKILFYMSEVGCLRLLFYIRGATFLLGGLIANLEIDFKKVVAFSTISQIRMIIIFSCLMIIELRCLHIFFHALFKTLLFCCSGLFFIKIFRDQFKNKFQSNQNERLTSVLFFTSIFSMTGLVFSSSFFSKDLVLEWLFISQSNFFSIVIMIGRIFTLLYCSRLMSLIINFFYNFRVEYKKYFKFNFIIIFLVYTALSGKCLKIFLTFDTYPILNFSLVFLLNIIFFVVLSQRLNNNYKILKNFSINISFMKSFTYSYFSKIFMSWKIEKFTGRDLTLFKPTFLIINLVVIENGIFKFFKSVYLLIFSLLLVNIIFYSFSLNRT